VAICVTASMSAGDLDGRYVGVTEPSVSLTMQEAAGGKITGTLSEAGITMPLTAQRQGDGFAGTLGPAGQSLRFTAMMEKDLVTLQIGPAGEGGALVFRRAGTGADAPANPGQRNVVINGKNLSEAELARAEQTYRIRIPDADYWYDRVLGAWGARGGPALGLIAPGLDLGGPLQADASGGGTNVFVNGRALHPYDLVALQQITGPVMAGRYFITADGLAGFEGGPPLWNLAALAAQAQGGGGGSNSWQSSVTGASGFSDGTTSAVFLPDGGIVSTGQ
jgi:hypothetical protein